MIYDILYTYVSTYGQQIQYKRYNNNYSVKFSYNSKYSSVVI